MCAGDVVFTGCAGFRRRFTNFLLFKRLNDLAQAIQLLTSHGAVFCEPRVVRGAYCIAQVAQELSVARGWVRDHLEEFPNRFRLPGGGQNGGEWRIPIRDVDAFQERRRVKG